MKTQPSDYKELKSLQFYFGTIYYKLLTIHASLDDTNLQQTILYLLSMKLNTDHM